MGAASLRYFSAHFQVRQHRNDLTGGNSQILSTLPRHSCFSRREPGPIPRDQAAAAIFDYVFVLQSMNQNYNPRRLER